MKTLCILLICCCASVAQSTYRASYDRSGKLLGLSNLIEPPNCGLMKFKGPIKYVRNSEDDSIQFAIQPMNSGRYIEMGLSQLSNADRGNFYHYILKKGHRVEVHGYACGSNGIVEPISIRSVQ